LLRKNFFYAGNVIYHAGARNIRKNDLLAEVLGDEARWKRFAAKVKRDNLRWPAFQEGLSKVLPDWREIK